jgi:hemerythrin
MPLEWTPELSVGRADLDAQHVEIFRRGARLITALRAGDRGEVGPTIAYLSAYASTHFAEEEKLMREAAYPGLADHARQHSGFVAELGRLAAGFDRKGATALLAMEIHNWLAGWLRSHLGETDRALVEYLRQRGVT